MFLNHIETMNSRAESFNIPLTPSTSSPQFNYLTFRVASATIDEWIPQSLLDKRIGPYEDLQILVWSIIMILLAFYEQQAHFMTPADYSSLFAILEGCKFRVYITVPNTFIYKFHLSVLRS